MIRLSATTTTSSSVTIRARRAVLDGELVPPAGRTPGTSGRASIAADTDGRPHTRAPESHRALSRKASRDDRTAPVYGRAASDDGSRALVCQGVPFIRYGWDRSGPSRFLDRFRIIQSTEEITAIGTVYVPLPDMPWRCPACRTHVQHSSTLPRADRVYRCPVCRLQMRFDPTEQKMKPLSPNGDDDGQKTPYAA
jgi:hypothetical protein